MLGVLPMQIQHVLTGLADAALTGARKHLVRPTNGSGPEATETSGGSVLSPSRMLADIVGHYDVTDITPAEFSELIHKLSEAGVLADSDLETLAAVRVELEAEGVDADESVDLLEFYSDRLERLRRDLQTERGSLALKKQFGDVLRRLQWLQKLAVIHSDPSSLGLDATA